MERPGFAACVGAKPQVTANSAKAETTVSITGAAQSQQLTALSLYIINYEVQAGAVILADLDRE